MYYNDVKQMYKGACPKMYTVGQTKGTNQVNCIQAAQVAHDAILWEDGAQPDFILIKYTIALG